MDFLKAIDSVFESINTNEINGNSRMTYLLFVFVQLKSINFDLTDLDEKTTLYITQKLTTKTVSPHLDKIQEMFVFMDVRQAAAIILDKEKKVKVVEPHIPQKEIAKPVEPQSNYNPEVDVLEEEGLLEPPPKRGMIYDKEFLKTLGISVDE